MSIQIEHSIPIKQLLVNEILVNRSWGLYDLIALVVTKLAIT